MSRRALVIFVLLIFGIVVASAFFLYGSLPPAEKLNLIPTNRSITYESVSDAGITVAGGDEMRTFRDLLPENTKSRKLEVKIHNRMPDDPGDLLIFSNASTWGKDGVGIGCGSINNLDDTSVATVDLYVTTNKLVELYGKEQTEQKVDGLLKSCLAKTLVGNSLQREQFDNLMKSVNESLSGESLVAIEI